MISYSAAADSTFFSIFLLKLTEIFSKFFHSSFNRKVDSCPIRLQFLFKIEASLAAKLSFNVERDACECGNADFIGFETLYESIIKFSVFFFVLPRFRQLQNGELVSVSEDF